MSVTPPVSDRADWREVFDPYGPHGRSAWRDVPWREHLRWVTVDGRRVNLVDIGSGPPVVFIHGLGVCWQTWLENIPHFAERHRVVALDLPGSGWSEMPAEDISISGYAQCVDAVCDELGIERAVVVGNSMGGFIGAELAISMATRVDKLVLVSAAILWNELRRARPIATFANLAQAVGAAVSARWELAVTRPRLRGWSLMNVVRHPLRLPPELAYEVMSGSGKPGFVPALNALASYRIRDRLPEIACPLLVVWGADDALVPVAQADVYVDLVAGTRKEVFPDTGHMAMLERPAAFNRLVDGFLAG